MSALTINPETLQKLEWTGIAVMLSITATEVFITIAPYFGLYPQVDVSLLSQISQQQTIMQNAFIAALSFLIGSSVGTRKKDDTIANATVALAASSPNPPDK